MAPKPTLRTRRLFSLERIWNLRLNMDTFNGAYMKLRSDPERLEYFLGWHLGCLDGEISESDSKAFQAGFSVGRGMLDEAKAFAEKQAERGRASAESRRAKSGTAQPFRTTDRTERRTAVEPPFDNSSNQSTIHNPQSTNPTNEQTKKPLSSCSRDALAIYEAYPKKVERPEALKEISAALKIIPCADLIEAVQAYAVAVSGWPEEEKKFIPSCGRWMKKQKWLDDRSTWKKSTKQSKNGVKHDGFATTDYLAGLDGLPTF